MSDTLVENVGAVVTGDLETPLRHVDNIYIRNGVIEEFDSETTTADTVVDAKGTTVAPGLIDGHVHPVSGGFTPRQNTLGWTESYLQSGVTSMVSAGEIHQPGRPKDAAGTKALAILNKKSFENERPGGVKMHAGTLVLTDDLDVSDIDDVHAEGVDHTKIIFPLSDLDHAAALVARAKELGMTTMMHCGGASVPGTQPIGEEMFRAIEPDIALHFNGGPTAIPDEERHALVEDTDLDVELVVAGNQRTSVETLETMMARGELDRVQIATDTPTGTGVVPCGMWLEAGILASMTDVSAADVLCLMTGTPAAHNDLDTGVLAEGRPADLCVLDAPLGSVGDDALAAIENGDYPSVSAVLVDGDVLVEGSRNTGPAKNPAEVV